MSKINLGIGIFIIIVVAAVLLGVVFFEPEPVEAPTEVIPVSEVVSAPTVIPISHATAILNWGDTVIYMDPTGGAEAFVGKPPANVVLVTDIHADHLDVPTLQAVSAGAVVIAPLAVQAKLPEDLAARLVVMKNGETITQGKFAIEAIPMYNLPESADARHTRGRGNGYVIERDGYRVYIAGDTAGTPEMRALRDIDMALVPMNPPYTMTVQEAAEAVLAFKPVQVIPYHYRGEAGLSDVQQFKTLVNAGNLNIDVVLMHWYP